MFPCCDHTYAKYIKNDGSIDNDRLRVVVAQSGADEKAAEAFLADPCKCVCHMVGAMVMH